MNQNKAFTETLNLAHERGMDKLTWDDTSKDLSYAHLEDMATRITDDFSESKLGRWLGWAQAAVVAAGIATLDEMKEINLRNST